METSEFNLLCRWLQENAFRLVIVEGPRGVGKTTFCDNLIKCSDLIYYKTWGRNQKWHRHEMQENLHLVLPQGTYFVLDFVAQTQLAQPVLADRGNLSALVYQRDEVWGQNKNLREYYSDLMHDCRAVTLVLSGPEEVLTRRRVGRTTDDEQSLHLMTERERKARVLDDIYYYEKAVSSMLRSGWKEVGIFQLDEGCFCSCYVSKKTLVKDL